MIALFMSNDFCAIQKMVWSWFLKCFLMYRVVTSGCVSPFYSNCICILPVFVLWYVCGYNSMLCVRKIDITPCSFLHLYVLSSNHCMMCKKGSKKWGVPQSTGKGHQRHEHMPFSGKFSWAEGISHPGSGDSLEAVYCSAGPWLLEEECSRHTRSTLRSVCLFYS